MAIVSATRLSTVFFLGIMFCGTSAQTGSFLPEQILLRSLGYIRGVQSWENGMQMGIVCDTERSASQEHAKRIADRINSAKLVKPVHAYVICVSDAEGLKEEMAMQRLNLLYLPLEANRLAQTVVKIGHQEHIAVLSETAEFASGAMLALRPQGNKAKLVLNMAVLKNLGGQLDPRLLRSIEIVGHVDKAPLYQKPKLVRSRLLSGQDPAYPRMARQAKLRGKVAVRIQISAEGRIESMHFIKTNEVFEPAVRQALAEWTFRPFLTDGQAVATYTIMVFRFQAD